MSPSPSRPAAGAAVITTSAAVTAAAAGSSPDAPTRSVLTLVHEPDGVRMLLARVVPGAPGSASVVVEDAVGSAVHEAQERSAHHVLAVVEVSGAVCAPLLEAARHRVGVDVGEIRTRRAGSSVMVDLELLP